MKGCSGTPFFIKLITNRIWQTADMISTATVM